MRWISVNEELPKGFMDVLINIPDQAPLPTVHEGYYANGQWFCKGNIFTKEVSHWAEMPSPPESEE